jgi:hypothetical protein
LPEGALPTATDEPAEEPAPQASAGAQDSLNGAGVAESPNGVHSSYDVTTAPGYEQADPGAEPQPEVAAAEAPAARVVDSSPSPDVPGTPASTSAHEEPPLPAAAAVPPGEEPPTQADDPYSAYRYGPATDYQSQPDAGYAYGYEPDYMPGYATETGYNQGMTQPVEEQAAPPPAYVEEQAAPPPAYPADLPTSATRSGARSTFARSLPRPKQRARARSEVVPARRANLVIARLEPWSVMKFSFLMSLVAWVVLFVAVALLYYALSSLGVFESIQKTLASVTSSTSSSGVNLTKWTSAPRVLGYTMLVGAVDVILITALATIGAMVYNLVTHLGGGIEVTLKETD